MFKKLLALTIYVISIQIMRAANVTASTKETNAKEKILAKDENEWKQGKNDEVKSNEGWNQQEYEKIDNDEDKWQQLTRNFFFCCWLCTHKVDARKGKTYFGACTSFAVFISPK